MESSAFQTPPRSSPSIPSGIVRPLAEHLGRAGAGATAAEDVRFEDGPGGPKLVAVEDLADESGDVDVRRAGPRAGGVEAEQATRRLDERLVGRQRGRDVGESGL